MYDVFGCALDFAHNFRHLMLTTLNCGATRQVACTKYRLYRRCEAPSFQISHFFDSYSSSHTTGEAESRGGFFVFFDTTRSEI